MRGDEIDTARRLSGARVRLCGADERTQPPVGRAHRAAVSGAERNEERGIVPGPSLWQ